MRYVNPRTQHADVPTLHGSSAYKHVLCLILRDVLKILDLSFADSDALRFGRFSSFSGVILSSLISHIARYVPSSTYKSTHAKRTKINST